MKNFQTFVLISLTTAFVKNAAALECYNCNASWSATMCFKNSRMETCSYRRSVCLTVDTKVTNLKGEKSNLFLRQCAPKYKCNSRRPCKDIKLQLWRERPDLFVDSTCRPKCCYSDHCNHPIPKSNLPKPSTRKVPPTAKPRNFPRKCLEFKSEFMSKLPGKKPLEKNCLENGQFDSCFSLQAQVFDSTKWKVAEKLEWKDCAIDDRDCHTIKNKCVQVRELAKSRGVYVTNCIVRCCYQDLCNALNATMSPTGNQLEVMANRSRGASGFSTLIVAFLAVLLELLAW